jgi:ribosome hibernation promoting factor
MNITITGRHLTLSDKQKNYAETKTQRLEKYFNQLVDAHIVLQVNKKDHSAEVLINGDGVQFHGKVVSGDFFSAIDLLFDKMERQINRYKEKHSSHKVITFDKLLPFEYEGEKGEYLKLNQANNKPIDRIEAYLQMKVNNSDFFLFKMGIPEVDSNIDLSNKCYAVIQKDGDKLKMVKVPIDKVKNQKFEFDTFIEYDITIKKDSSSNPELEFIENKNTDVQKLTIDEALEEIENKNSKFITFFNKDSHYFNVIYKNGNNYEVMVPAF